MEAHVEVEVGAASTSVLVLHPGETKLVGRGPGVDLALADPSLAPRHLALQLLDDGLYAVALVGPGAARLGDAPLPVRHPTPAESGDLLHLGASALRVRLVGLRRRPRPSAALPFPAGEFDEVRELGAGATSKVYAARWARTGRPVALKLLRADVVAGSPEHQRFHRELAAAARLRSPYVAAVHDLRAVEGRLFLILELLSGPALDALLAAGPLPLGDALRLAEDVARALGAAAAAGIVHRDVKPANVLLCREARLAKLCDLGLAKAKGEAGGPTVTGHGVGTLAYIAPEQLLDAKRAQPPADVHALGATLYHLVAGRPPFDATAPDVLERIARQPPPRLAALRPDVPAEVSALADAALLKNPAARPTAAAMAAQLRALRLALCPRHDPAALFAGRAPT